MSKCRRITISRKEDQQETMAQLYKFQEATMTIRDKLVMYYQTTNLIAASTLI